ncbi:cyclic nucleotide-binding domain-containing protein [Mesorhizobium sp. CO1-1-7]|uniref:cyclic nucleotide-gated potassium channel n=1 Tax=unclassified Mesorhizobium TaxID=325217 RepID=UPI001126D9DD|nr:MULTISPECIES: cyclic nucleotide-gated potassium channel [unclassified Mesorhizobium]MBZ9747827.1 cyclic nucleotide-binding domain-containing protein [Mesorhizobium sp. CO1-1-7]TPJ12138.1 cyclic nucleotide-binding domain-containing protein [Mesorhizobium sp. B2-7-3]TPL74309.1 cyclic nucleotide-binding domain-containing protein [Mesorhizobium sp. B2-3-15]TPL99534.1 cyclic nucleotide-binding domain-containing protein [Mesorhizobium sp. B2-3-10]
MSVLPFLRIHAPLNAVLAAPGLLAVAALTMPDMSARSRLALTAVLAVIWGAYLLQMAETLIKHWAGDLRDRTPAIAIDMLAVLVPLAAFLLEGTPDRSLYCAVWLLKPLRDSTFFPVLGRVLANEARNLIGVTTLFGVVLFGVALAAYVIERHIQPEKFGSIPQAMWWAVVTLSTTGYGDAIPQSFAGRVLAGAVMMCGIGVFALWAGILASGFYQEIRREDFVRNWQLVAAVPLFQKLGPAALVEIVRALRPRSLPAGAVICRRGETGDRMFFVVEGRVSVVMSNPVELGPGAFFGEMALMSGEPRTATVSAATAVSLLSLHAADFQMLCSSSPEIAEIIRKTARERHGTAPTA